MKKQCHSATRILGNVRFPDLPSDFLQEETYVFPDFPHERVERVVDAHPRLCARLDEGDAVALADLSRLRHVDVSGGKVTLVSDEDHGYLKGRHGKVIFISTLLTSTSPVSKISLLTFSCIGSISLTCSEGRGKSRTSVIRYVKKINFRDETGFGENEIPKIGK